MITACRLAFQPSPKTRRWTSSKATKVCESIITIAVSGSDCFIDEGFEGVGGLWVVKGRFMIQAH